MREIKNETTEIEANKQRLDYRGLMIYCVKFPVQGGFDIEEIRRRIRLLDLLDKSQDNDSEENKVIRLEDQDLINLRKCVKVTRFNNIHKDIVTFIDKVMKD